MPRQASAPFNNLASWLATSATAPSDVVIRNTPALAKSESHNVIGLPWPINRAARCTADGLRPATKAMDTPAAASSRPIAWPMRPGPMMATL